MDDTDTRAGPERADRGVGEAFDLVASKLLHPLVRPGTVRRSMAVVGLCLILFGVRRHRHHDQWGFGQTAKKLGKFGPHLVKVSAIGIQKLFFAGRK